MTGFSTSLDELVDLLDLAPDGPDAFRAAHSRMARHNGHVYGGLVAAQALTAAGRTVVDAVGDGRAVHSLHAYFLRPGRSDRPIRVRVERTRDGRSFSHRRVTTLQDDTVIMELSCSFAVTETGLEHQVAAPEVPAPEDLPSDVEMLRLERGIDPTITASGPLEVRSALLHALLAKEAGLRSDRSLVWMRAQGELPEDPALHAAVFVYASDMMILDPTTRPHGLALLAFDVRPATIDHTIWFHSPVRMDRWNLHDLHSPWTGGGRGLGRGRVFDRAGRLVAEVVQEGLIRAR